MLFRIGIILICTSLGVSLWGQESSVESQIRLEELGQELQKRLAYTESIHKVFPPLKYEPKLPSNARFEKDTIWLGQVQHAFHTTDDTLSILYHEYIHYLLDVKYSYTKDSTGQIVQWDTGETYTYLPTQAEIEEELRYFREHILPGYGNISQAQKSGHLQQLKKDLSKPRQLPFIYAPSDLAKEEIEAYEAQLIGEKLGLYVLSKSGKASIERKLYQIRDTLNRRLVYEQKQGLNSDGSRMR